MKIIPGRSSEWGLLWRVCLCLTAFVCLAADRQWVFWQTHCVKSCCVPGRCTYSNNRQTHLTKSNLQLLQRRLYSIFKPVYNVTDLNYYEWGWLPSLFSFIWWYVDRSGWGQGLRREMSPPPAPHSLLSGGVSPVSLTSDLYRVYFIQNSCACVRERLPIVSDWAISDSHRTTTICYRINASAEVRWLLLLFQN